VSADRTGATPRGASGGVSGRLWPEEEPAEAEEILTPDATGRLTNLSYISATLRRRARFWCAAAVIGMVIAVGLYVKHPPPYTASIKVLLTLGPNEDLNTAIASEAVLAGSRPVAGDALRALGSHENVDTFLSSYTVAPLTNKILVITANGPSSTDAVGTANAVAAAFLKFRASQLQNQVQLVTSSLTQLVNSDQAKVNALSRQITQARAQPPSPSRSSQLKQLLSERSRAKDALNTMQQTLRSTESNAQAATIYANRGSVTLGAASPDHHSRFKVPAEYGIAGLIGGMAVGMGIVIIQALASGRLRRRDDIALALGAPVKLSLGRVRVRGAAPGRRGEGGSGNRDIDRIAEHLRKTVSRSPQGAASLAVVPVDSTQIAALAVVELALACARQGQRVMLADLVPGSPAARLVDTAEPGVRMVNADGAHLVVAVPDADDITPTGPLHSDAQAPPALVKACKSADLLLTLVTLDPANGGDHLAGWAKNAVAVVTAGESSWTKIHAVGEMIRLSGVRLRSAVLVGADKQDESLGTVPGAPPAREAEPVGKTAPPDPERLFVALDAGQGAAPPPGNR
jgi:capsular polysaccharide biosynthesis protein